MTKKKVDSTEVVSWEDQMAQEAKAVAKLERPTVSTIGLRAGVITLGGQEVPDNKFEGIITAVVKEHVWYEEKWDPDRVVPPNCFALARLDNDLVPHPVVTQPIGEVCATCKFQKWEGRTPPICKTRRRFSIIPAIDKAEEIAEAEMAQMSISVTSISSPQNAKNWTKYVNFISAKYQRPVWGVITEISAKPHPKHQFHVHFDFVKLIEDGDMLSALNARKELDEESLLTPYEMSQEQTPEEGDKKY